MTFYATVQNEETIFFSVGIINRHRIEFGVFFYLLLSVLFV